MQGEGENAPAPRPSFSITSWDAVRPVFLPSWSKYFRCLFRIHSRIHDSMQVLCSAGAAEIHEQETSCKMDLGCKLVCLYIRTYIYVMTTDRNDSDPLCNIHRLTSFISAKASKQSSMTQSVRHCVSANNIIRTFETCTTCRAKPCGQLKGSLNMLSITECMSVRHVHWKKYLVRCWSIVRGARFM